MKYLLFITLLSITALSHAQDWRAESRGSQSGLQRIDSHKGVLARTSTQEPGTKTIVSRPQYHGNEDIWVYDAWMTLDSDKDHDGYYSDFTLNIDADTYYTSAAIYAVLYLGVEDEFREYHTSSVFTLYGQDSEDYFQVNTTLVEGFPSDDYEILVEVYDADTHDLVAVYDGYSDSDLLYLPLESIDYEHNDTRVVVNYEGGSMGAALSSLLLALVGWRRIKYTGKERGLNRPPLSPAS